jgi:GntR family phosphonate transport system transcriptional regulator
MSLPPVGSSDPGISLDRGDGLALWRQISETLGHEIGAGVFQAGQRLPAEAELAVRFRVNRHTIRRAVAALQDQGLVRIEQGRGTFVLDPPIDYRLGPRTRFTENVVGQHRVPSGAVLRAAEVPADASMAQNLGLRLGAPVALIETIRFADAYPLSVGQHYFPLDRFPDIIRVHAEETRITETFRRFGVTDYTRRSTRITARAADEWEAHHLQLPRNGIVLVSESVNVDAAGQPIEWGVARFAANRVQIVVEP